ncbi:hypothetical protein [Macrococcus sp. DPC7161]|uniref:hypothetical protein n=1 Tax=Macrococcus sp. DPC7161 TaxID=2507060 RepID=UPI00100BCF73|nr:hypothetical protein [Macrococcus sp. DPC7161]RXK18260.1 hypothetical protein ER639_06095 [Macrococcus sp. DPC7161]
MKRLPKLFSGKLTAYQISTATDIDITIIESLLDETATLDILDDAAFAKLKDLELSLFNIQSDNNETIA